MNTRPALAPSRLTARSAFGLAAIALLGYFDWITHREAATSIVLIAIAGALVVFRDEALQRSGLAPMLRDVPSVIRPVLAALPALAYFLIRGQGTSGAGEVVLLSMGITVGTVALGGPAIDAKLAGFYVARNRILPLPLRMTLALVVPVLVAFLVIHGSLADLAALFGGTTNHPMPPSGREGRFLFGTLLSAASAFLLVREAPGSAAARQPEQIAGAQPGWSHTHVVPAGGLDAWISPDPSTPVAARLEPGLPLQVVATSGGWAQVTASNGWSGWVDARRLEAKV